MLRRFKEAFSVEREKTPANWDGRVHQQVLDTTYNCRGEETAKLATYMKGGGTEHLSVGPTRVSRSTVTNNKPTLSNQGSYPRC